MRSFEVYNIICREIEANRWNLQSCVSTEGSGLVCKFMLINWPVSFLSLLTEQEVCMGESCDQGHKYRPN